MCPAANARTDRMVYVDCREDYRITGVIYINGMAMPLGPLTLLYKNDVLSVRFFIDDFLNEKLLAVCNIKEENAYSSILGYGAASIKYRIY